MDSTTNQFADAAAGASSANTAPLPAMLADALIGAGAGGGDGDPSAALQRLAALGDRMAAVRRLLVASISGESQPLSSSDIQSVSSEISSAAHLVVLNAASLLSSSLPFPAPSAPPAPPAPIQELPAAASTADVLPQEATKGYDVVELDADELLAEHVHFCNICGKGFRRDANLRMHMRAHGDRFKTLDALSRPGQAKPADGRDVRFSCPFTGCNRNRAHRRFRPLKSAVCARNHFRRSHCPKLYACERCGGKKRFAVLADLRGHLRHCDQGVKPVTMVIMPVEIKKEHQVLMVHKNTSFKKKGKGKKKGNFKKNGKIVAAQEKKPKFGPKPETECFYCKGTGHWKRKCPKYLADKKDGKVNQIKNRTRVVEIKKEHPVLMVNKTTSFKKKGKGKKKGNFKKNGKQVAAQEKKPKSGPKPETECFYCKGTGH
ncbi:Zinc finger protein STOP1-like protein [Triticum urartu]|uniref:Zinc finger protein STOP1-like protein n=1 Tax=Triticum urartu TaxID=4572 RepID=M7ZI81_TRIUA|nr:Zinc finger protein STOP1-like protein [Triticum urartu]